MLDFVYIKYPKIAEYIKLNDEIIRITDAEIKHGIMTYEVDELLNKIIPLVKSFSNEEKEILKIVCTVKQRIK
jgi:hypothetical protein